MGKKILSLCMALALCLGLLPVTALAVDAPATLYVGNNQVIVAETVTYWSTNDSGELTRVENATDASKDWTVRYNPNTATLTLNEAKISGSYHQYNNPFTAGIYAKGSSDQPVALTIELIGTNTITGAYGIFLDAETNTSSYGTNATLTITGESNGILKVSGSSSYGIYVKSGTGNASLTIENASVDATSSVSYSSYAGVCVGSSDSATAPALSLAVNGGSLTTSASEGNDGIQFIVGSSEPTGATTSLTVSDNAIVRANGGIKASLVDEPTPSGTGIVFDGTEGTVYGDVTLDESLTINQGETLTIPEGSTLNTNNNLTNNGTILASGGTLEGTLSNGTTPTTPNITEQPYDDTVTEGEVATFTVEASAGSETLTYQWQQSTDNGSSWTNIERETNASYTINSTNTSMNGYQYRCVVTGSGGVSVISQTATLTVQAKPASVPVTGVKLNTETLELFTGNTATLTATVEPDNATNKNVTWSSDKPAVATVEGGTVTARGAGEATITVTTEDGEKTATCTVTVTDKTYKISADATALDFGSAYTSYTQPAAQTVTITNTGNQPLTLTQPASTSSFEVGTLSTTELAAGATATFTVQPKAGLAVGTYSENITVSDSGHVTLSIPATFTVRQYSSGGGPPTKTPSQQAVDKIEAAKDGSTVEIKLSTGSTKLDKEVFEELAGRDVTLEISLSNGVTWTVNGQDIPENADLTDLDLGVTLDASTIPVSVVNTITGAVDTIQISLKHDGEFGFTMTLSAPLGKTNAGYWANLYYYNEDSRALEFQSADKIASDGTAEFAFSHASDYAIVIDTDSHEPVELPFTDVPEGYWAHSEIAWAYVNGYMNGTATTTFNPGGMVTRQQMWMILARMAGANPTDMAAAKAWAVANGISDGSNPGSPVTRQQLATLLYRYAVLYGYDVSVGESTNILSYADVGQLSEYAIPAMQWAVGAGIIKGTGDGSTLTPQGDSTRAQLAVMLYRFMGSM